MLGMISDQITDKLRGSQKGKLKEETTITVEFFHELLVMEQIAEIGKLKEIDYKIH
jgi:hypothetical protein